MALKVGMKKCLICDKMIKEVGLKRHIERTHLETTCKCNECGKTLSCNSLDEHIKRKHNKDENFGKAKEPPKTKKESSKIINCDLCEKKFSSLRSMRNRLGQFFKKFSD